MMRQRLKETGRHTIVFGIGTVLRQAINFLLLPVYTRYLTPAEYGTLSLLLIGGDLIALFPAATIAPALFRSYYDYDREADRIIVVSTALWLSAAMAAVLLALGLGFRSPLAQLLTGASDYANLMGLVVFNSFFLSINSVSIAVFRARKHSGKYLVVSLIAMCVSILTTVYLIVVRGWGITGVITGVLAGGGISAGVYLWMIRRQLQPVFSVQESRKMLSFGAPFIPANLLGFFENAVALVAVQHLLGTAAVGLFALARRLGQIVGVTFFDPLNLILPAIIFSAEKDERAKEFYARLLTYVLLIGICIATAISLLGTEILMVMTKETFWKADSLVPWMCLAAVFFGVRSLASAGLSLKRKTIWFPLARALSTGLYFGLMFALAPRWGVTGAAIALTVGHAAGTALRTAASQTYFKIPFEMKRISKIVLAAGLCLIFGQVVDCLGLSVFPAAGAKLSVFLILFPAVLFMSRFPDQAELKTIRAKLRGRGKQGHDIVTPG